MIPRNQILQGEAQETLSQLDSQIVSLVVTSPPYKERDGFSYRMMNGVFRELYRVQQPNSLLFLNFGHLVEDKMRPFKVATLACDNGYELNETFVWIKNHFKPIQGSKRVNNLTEFVFLLYKGKMPRLDRLAIGVPYVDVSNAKRFAQGRNLRCRGNIWHIPYQTINKKSEKLHNDRFPLQLPAFCISLSGIPKGSLVLDPFIGSGTTAVAAVNAGMDFIGIDREKYWVEMTKNRLKQMPTAQKNMFENPLNQTIVRAA